MRIASIVTIAAALALPVTAFATPKKPATPSEQTRKPVKVHHLAKTAKPIAGTRAPATPVPAAPAPAAPSTTKAPMK